MVNSFMKRMKRKNFDDLFDEMQNLYSEFQNMGKDVAEMAPIGRGVPVDIHEEDGKMVIEAELPGVSKEDINLRADGKKVDISAESSQEVKEQNEKYYRQERSSRKFRRRIQWPEKVDPETIEASYDDGVLRVEAEREEMNGRDIDVE